MEFGTALIHGLIWSLMWGSAVTFIEIRWPHIFLHDYPKELQKVIKLPPFRNKRGAYIFTTAVMAIIMAFLFWSGIDTYKAKGADYLELLGHVLTVILCWNLFDLIILDWLIFCTWRPKFIVLPGSEGHPAYRDYRFHFIGFLKGCLISALGALIIAAICHAVLRYVI